ncbi:hypothetical protein TIFTF001_012914 [Ficus carica]|uniref:Pentatricopeptide repeat-containing protein n=1 Tax=Ficus carica TaxID=3494 RepID=A0AA88A0X8_FICCA|nr:hypothetical protein TIFTF001_012914 [Ficus carica]
MVSIDTPSCVRPKYNLKAPSKLRSSSLQSSGPGPKLRLSDVTHIPKSPTQNLTKIPCTLTLFLPFFIELSPPNPHLATATKSALRAELVAAVAAPFLRRVGIEAEPFDMAAEEGDEQGGPDRRQGAQEAPVRPLPARPVHALPRLSPAQVRSRLRPRRAPETGPGLPLHEVRKEIWYRPDMFFYRDMLMMLSRNKKVDEVKKVWEDLKREEVLFDQHTFGDLVRAFLDNGLTSEAMDIYDEMRRSPDPPISLPFRVILKGLIPYPELREKVKDDFLELFPSMIVYDPPEDLFEDEDWRRRDSDND